MDFQNELRAEYDRETAKTRKMLEALPEDADFEFKPHPKSMSLGRLAGHLTDMTGHWALNTLTKDKIEFSAESKYEPYIATNKAALLERFDKDLPTVGATISSLPLAQWDAHWQMIFNGRLFVDLPRHQVFREMVLSHMVHHRAQLGVYLRLLDKPIPGTYGPSADGM